MFLIACALIYGAENDLSYDFFVTVEWHFIKSIYTINNKDEVCMQTNVCNKLTDACMVC